ncbi:acetate kinase [Aerococcus christensenii]|uniref:Acetate kinase n=1 Tax=Aerococcus christensenii TaxID=87541 RepID=A0A133XQ95_9LACT|nr:acetate kinase [Aerococcus christensenii]KXB33105.1 acetate kinase [Aerococcus christensenii]MDK8233408.1 acetate kinase [Aerococcus christensenii]PKY91294.1 acetate kinase [Aerococcus christensenii]WEB71602.1 acetate kinase [Aerococcus christensenii]
MSKIFALNAGSSSLKFSIFEIPSEEVVASGLIDRIGLNDSNVVIKYNGEKFTDVKDVPDHDVATKILLEKLKTLGIIKNFDEIAGTGHRVVAGGEVFKDSLLIGEDELNQIDALSEYAPLHNPAEVKVIRAFHKLLPGKPAVGVFDTSFHTTMPAENYLYGVPYEYYEKYGARKYGAHGTSHKYVSLRCAELMGKKPEEVNIITCHVGNGASITAVKKGKSIDTSMGFTPVAGVVMGTRSGDVDPSMLAYIMEKEHIDMTEMLHILNNESGLKGLSGVSSDMRDVEEAMAKGNKRAKIALDVYISAVRRYVGSYLAELNGADAIVFTAGVGENSAPFREQVLADMENLGIKIDKERNESTKEGLISTDDSRVKVYVIPTDEELMIVRDTVRLGHINA